MTLVDRMNQEVKQLKPSDILQFNAAISGIEGIVKLTLGEPDFPTPEHVRRPVLHRLKTMRVITRKAKDFQDCGLLPAIILRRNTTPNMTRKAKF